MRRVILCSILSCLVAVPAPTLGDSGVAGLGWVTDSNIVADARNEPRGGERGTRRRVRPVCTYELLFESSVDTGSWYVQRCRDREGTEFAWQIVHREQGAQVDPAGLAQQALDSAVLPLPVPAVSPEPDRQLVHVPTWLWVEGGWQPVTATASVPGVTVSVTAAPESVTWDMGNGDQVVCRGPGTRYDPDRPSDQQSTDCSYTYRRSSAGQTEGQFVVTATMRWRVTWTASGVAGGGDLGGVSRSSTLPVRVAEGQALVER